MSYFMKKNIYYMSKIKKITSQKNKTIVQQLPREQVQIVIGKSAFKMTDSEDLYLKMITAHLSGQGSELFVEVRDKQGLCYAVQPVHMSALEGGAWGIYIGAGKDKKQAAIDAIKNILKKTE